MRNKDENFISWTSKDSGWFPINILLVEANCSARERARKGLEEHYGHTVIEVPDRRTLEIALDDGGIDCIFLEAFGILTGNDHLLDRIRALELPVYLVGKFSNRASKFQFGIVQGDYVANFQKPYKIEDFGPELQQLEQS